MKKSNLKKFQHLLKTNNIDLYIIPTSDYHNSEYINDYFKVRQYLSNFTGSAGTLLVSQENAYLFVDGRYFVQVEKEVNKDEITIMKLGEKGVPSLLDFISSYLQDGNTLSFDGKVVNYNFIFEIKELVKNKKINFKIDNKLIDLIWKNRPSLPNEPLFSIANFCGETTKNKISKIREKMSQYHATTHIISTLDDIAYILNLRGNDIPCNPVFLSYLLISKNNVILYINNDKINNEINKYLNDSNIIIKEYKEIYDDIKKIYDEAILLDSALTNYQIYETLRQNNVIINKDNPSQLMKAIKNDVEISNLRKCHIYDGLAMLDFMIFVKNIKQNNIKIDEYELSIILNKYRKNQPYFIENSFNPIIGYQSNAAMMHYSAKEKGSKKIKGNGLLLVDSGGQYYLGTTDITRTFVIGKINKTQKRHFTLALKSMFNLSSAIFLYGCNGQSLDILARGPLWNIGLDYKCGTGHGISYCLNVHEAPNGFRYKKVVDRNDSAVLEIGMTTTDEPGVYVENSHGIRHENVLLTIKHLENEQGMFLKFDTLTMCPFDLDGIDSKLLTKKDKNRINDYHRLVFTNLAPFCNENQLKYLTKFTKSI